MTHLLILCEGETERRVIKAFLKPYWEQRFDSAEVIAYEGNGDLKRHFAKDTQDQLASDPGSSVLCLVDLYEEPFKVYALSKMSVEQGFQAVQSYMYGAVDHRFHPRFGAFPVVMEIETWLLADDNSMQLIVGKRLTKRRK